MSVNLVTYTTDDSEVNDVADIPAIPPLLNLPQMEGRVICFYGFKPIVDSLKAVRLDAIKNRKKIKRIALSATSNEDARGTMADLHRIFAISIWRTDRALKDKIADTLKREIGEIHRGEIVTGGNIEKVLALNPMLFEILWKDKDFEHINVFLWRGKYNCATQLGVIRDRSVIERFDVTT